MILVAGKMVVAIDWTDSKAIAITALEICMLTQMVHGESWKNITKKMICLKSFSFVCVCDQQRRVIIAWCVPIVVLHFLLTFLINSLIVVCFYVKMHFLWQADDTSKLIHVI